MSLGAEIGVAFLLIEMGYVSLNLTLDLITTFRSFFSFCFIMLLRAFCNNTTLVQIYWEFELNLTFACVQLATNWIYVKQKFYLFPFDVRVHARIDLSVVSCPCRVLFHFLN